MQNKISKQEFFQKINASMFLKADQKEALIDRYDSMTDEMRGVICDEIQQDEEGITESVLQVIAGSPELVDKFKKGIRNINANTLKMEEQEEGKQEQDELNNLDQLLSK